MKVEQTMERLLTVKEIAMWLHVSPPLIYKWVCAGYVPHHKVGTLIRFRRSVVEHWLAVRQRKGRQTYKLDVSEMP